MVKDGIYYGLGLSGGGALAAYLASPWWGLPLFLVAAFCLYFFRDPERTAPEGPVAVAPADGKVVHLRDLPGQRSRLSIFLNIFNVHVNRVPVSGVVSRVEYRQGRFRLAHLEEASAANEQNCLTIETDENPVVVKQIAGLVARRIVCYKREGDKVTKGERLGLIKFGSRLDLELGPEWEFTVRPGDKVRGGSTVVARRRDACHES